MITIKLVLIAIGTGIIQAITHFTKRRDDTLPVKEVKIETPIVEPIIIPIVEPLKEPVLEMVKEIKTDITPETIIEVKKSIKELKMIKKILPSSQIMGKRNQPIKQICLHFTCGGSADSAINWWLKTPERISTNYLIEKNGDIIQVMEDTDWAFQLGMDNKYNEIPTKYKNRNHVIDIEKSLIGIELVMEGGLVLKENKFWFEDGQRFIPSENVVTLDKPFRGYKYYTKYTDAQIESTTKLVEYLKKKHNITTEELTYDISTKAVSGEKGLYSHVNYRSDKQDLYYFKKLHDSLKSI
jgi:N-acetyl-anhydromuramyl-L-alanine amidase AmpD